MFCVGVSHVIGFSTIDTGTIDNHTINSDTIDKHRRTRRSMTAETFSITDLAREFSVTSRAIRFYEDQGLISPRRDGQTRIYSRRDRARLAWILRGKRVGFSLAEIGEILDLYDLGDGRLTQSRVALARSREKIAALKQQRDDIDATIAELEAFCVHLDEYIAEALDAAGVITPASS